MCNNWALRLWVLFGSPEKIIVNFPQLEQNTATPISSDFSYRCRSDRGIIISIL